MANVTASSSFAAVLLACLVACGGGAEIGPEPATAATPAGPAKPAAPKVKVTKLARGGVRDTVRGGIGRFLQDVTLDDSPAFKNGKFFGFRVLELRGDLDACDLRPGDVITRVNGQSVEHPEEALVVFQSLATANELVVDYERDGAPLKMRLPIVDEPTASK